MTDNEIRTALEEASQGIIETDGDLWFYWSNERFFVCKDNDPLEDLNACAELEATLTDEEEQRMNDLLWDAMDGRKHLFRATPRQRCLAYLKTKGIIR